MESPIREVEVPSAHPSPGLPPPQPRSTPHYIIGAQEITADRESQLGTSRRTGSVFKGFWNDSVVAVKVLSSETPVDTLFDRIAGWQALRHPHVLQVFGVSDHDADPPFIISQYFLNGNASDYLMKNSSADRAKIIFECALGMQYLNGRGIIHGSLKPTNILIADNGQACIADYGMIEIKPSATSSTRYFSPEAWKGAISGPSDVFAFAMSSYEIFMSSPPWGLLAENHIYQLVVREGDRPDRPERDVAQKRGLTDKIWGIMEVCWHKEAAMRPTFTQIVEFWQMQHGEDTVEILRPVSPSNSANASSSGHHPIAGEPHNIMTTVEAWRSNQNPESPTASLSSSPPAYRLLPAYGDVSPIGPQQLTRTFSTPGSVSDGQPRSSDSFVRSFIDSPRQFTSLPPTPSSISGDDDSQSLWIPTNSDANTLTPLTSNLSLYDRHQSTFGFGDLSRMPTISEGGRVYPNSECQPYGGVQSPPTSSTLMRSPTQIQDASWLLQRRFTTQSSGMTSDSHSSAGSGSSRGALSISVPSLTGKSNAVLLVGALHAEVTEGRKQDVIDEYLHKARVLASQSDKEAQKLVTAGIVPTVILLLKVRAVDVTGLELVLATLGLLACDPITANTINRTNTTSTLIEIINSTDSDSIMALTIWCIHRICRNAEVAAALVKQDLAGALIRKGIKGNLVSSRFSAWCLGILAYTDDLAETLSTLGAVNASVEHLRYITVTPNAEPEDQCAALYAVARLARTVSLSKSLAKAGCVPLIAHHLSISVDPQVLHWSARAIGCLQRPNASDLAKILLDAGAASALARLPRVLPNDEVEPLASFAFAIQRLSVAEWGAGTRKALVDAGVVDSLLSALRTSADVPYPQVHIELALATSFLGDVGGTSIRKEIVRAGGIEILKRVSAAGKPEVAKVCNMAITSITGNIWTRNAASAKTAMSHNWTGGCPEYQPECPLVSTID